MIERRLYSIYYELGTLGYTKKSPSKNEGLS